MRVLHFYQTYLPDSYGGIEQVIYQLCEGTSALGIDSRVLTLSANPEPRDITLGHHHVHRSKALKKLASTGLSLEVFNDFKRLGQEADIIHYQFPWPVMDLAHFFARHKKPTIVTYQSDIVRQKTLLKFYRPLMERFLGDVSKIVATSPNYVETSDVLAKFHDKICVIPNGIDAKTYPTPQPALIEQWKSRFSSGFFLFVGVMRYYKGLHILLEAARKIHYPIVIMGAGPIEESLRETARKHDLNHVHFVGALDDENKVALLQLSTAIVFPSHLRSEAFGVSLAEGAMFGKPLISSEIGTGTSYINHDGETGIVVPPSDPNALVSAMKTLWENKELASRYGRQAHSRYEQLFTAQTMCESYKALYEEVLVK